jgi:GT2 family glycosyltransferase
MIYTFIPYIPKNEEQHLGVIYNRYMELIGDDDWACIIDHDAMFTVKDWYIQLEDIIEKNPQFGLFTCYTNRIGSPYQVIKDLEKTHDIIYHRKIGKEIQSLYYDEVDLLKQPLSGVIILISKKTWKTVGGFDVKRKIFGVDNDIHKRCKENNIKVGIMKGVFVYHWYRQKI